MSVDEAVAQKGGFKANVVWKQQTNNTLFLPVGMVVIRSYDATREENALVWL
jgi:hypothetical protein